MEPICGNIQTQHDLNLFLDLFAESVVQGLADRFLPEFINNGQSLKLIQSEKPRNLA